METDVSDRLGRQRLIRKLESISDLTHEERSAILDIPMVPKSISADKDIVSIGDRPSECCLVLEGYVFRYKLRQDGSRQIMSFHTPGDVPDLQSLYLHTMDHSLGTLVPTTIALIQHRDLKAVIRKYEGLWFAFSRDALVDAAIFREWMVGIGRRSAHQRIAHLFCEFAVRTRAIGLNDGDRYPWPITQLELADALGLTDVHVNRVLRDLRREGLIALTRGSFTALDWDGLKRLGEFDPIYLHVRPDFAA